MQIKSTVRCQYTPTRMAKLVKTDTTLLWWGCGTNEHSYVTGGSTNDATTLGKCLAVLKLNVWWLLHPREINTYVHKKTA